MKALTNIRRLLFGLNKTELLLKKTFGTHHIPTILLQHQAASEKIYAAYDASSGGSLLKGKVNTGVKPKPPVKPAGSLQLTKLKFDTAYDVCADAVKTSDNYELFYIVEDGGAYYHWLLERKQTADKKKPKRLPITLHSNKKLSFTATFKVTSSQPLPATPLIKIAACHELKYTFTPQNGQSAGEFNLTFTATNLAYEDSICYIADFNLSFEYSTDGGHTWKSAGTAVNEMYITWKKPLVEAQFFHDPNATTRDPETEMWIRCTQTGTKLYIPETLLFLSCKNANGSGEGESERQVMDAIFRGLEKLHVHRRREIFTHMGYWRGKSAAGNIMEKRGVRYLLLYGEGRCGEWTELLLHLAYTHGITAAKTFYIVTEAFSFSISPVVTIGNRPYIIQYQPFLDFNPVTGNRIIIGQTAWDPADMASKPQVQMEVITGEDPVTHQQRIEIMTAVAVKMDSNNKPVEIIDYNTYQNCIFLVNEWNINDPQAPTEISGQAQGNKKPLNFFWDHVFVKFQLGKDVYTYYDPSYGKKTTDTFATDKSLLHTYAARSFSGVVMAALPKPGGQGYKMFDRRHSGKYINLYQAYDFIDDAPHAPAFLFKTITTDMEQHLIIQ